MTVGYDANERRDGEQWPAGRTHAVMPRLVAARTTLHLHRKLFVCSAFVLAGDVNLCCVLCASFVVISLHGMAWRVPSHDGAVTVC